MNMKDFTYDCTSSLYVKDSGVTMNYTVHFIVPAQSMIKAIEDAIDCLNTGFIGDDYVGADLYTDVEHYLFDDLCAGDIPFIDGDMDEKIADWIDEYLQSK